MFFYSECVALRDPYCSWRRNKCVNSVSGWDTLLAIFWLGELHCVTLLLSKGRWVCCISDRVWSKLLSYLLMLTWVEFVIFRHQSIESGEHSLCQAYQDMNVPVRPRKVTTTSPGRLLTLLYSSFIYRIVSSWTMMLCNFNMSWLPSSLITVIFIRFCC